jgi:hypothetical protein
LIIFVSVEEELDELKKLVAKLRANSTNTTINSENNEDVIKADETN